MKEYLRVRKQGIIRERIGFVVIVLGYIVSMIVLIGVANIIIGLN